MMPKTPITQPTSVPARHTNWVAVASADHAKRGREAQQEPKPAKDTQLNLLPAHNQALPLPSGFMQVCHGKRGPIARVKPGDRVAYYAPSITMGGKDKLQSFVSLGLVQPGEPYAFDMGGGFVPFRRDVHYLPAVEAPIAPLLDAFEFVEDRQRWGYKFRFGLFSISDHDMQLIAHAMQVPFYALHFK
jgi:EVE domain